MIDTNLPYCRRPSGPIALQRDQSTWDCHNNGTRHSFTSLMLNNVSVSTVLHQWNSSIQKAEEYSRYKSQRQSNETISGDGKYLCECKNPQSFGKHCEYLLPMGITFHETIAWEIEMRRAYRWNMHRYSDIVCYTTLICNSGLLCLDWRDICDGKQHCMYGYDEENCDTLEFNECEDDEYRCVNGMCIPDEYFLDGEYDCADLTDEKDFFDGGKCTFEQASIECDDRMCLRSYWSCGDGQCIGRRLDFQSNRVAIQCNSLREQYYMCEIAEQVKWTLPNGKCYPLSDYEEVLVQNRTDSEECLYFVKCVLSKGIEKKCPCKSNVSYCINKLKSHCSSSKIQYPSGAIIAPYAFSFYNAERYWYQWIPDGIIINGTLKCRGYMIKHNTTLEYPLGMSLQQLEATLCASKSNISILSDTGYDEFCHNKSRTFNNHSYHFIQVCYKSKECISAYRIKDGYYGDCAYSEDEQISAQFPNTCSKMQRHRFRCSSEEPSCLVVTNIGDDISNCRNARGELWMEEGIKLSELICNSESKDDCGRIREYIESSWKLDTNNSSDRQLELSKIPFRSFCDTFWNSVSKKDEDIVMCQKWWKCPENQWQCRTGQCIEIEWVLDGEWDCVDASDEQGLFFPTNNFSLRNLNLINNEKLIEKFILLYSRQPFWEICNLSMEYPCFRVNVSEPLNITHNRPCIGLHQIGDGYVDCVGSLDERNNLKHCLLSTMLGYNFQCSLTETCISYSSHCPDQCDNNRVQCYGYQQTSNCSDVTDFMCLDSQCAKDSWCNEIFDCSHGEDELFCLKRKGSSNISPIGLYREKKELSVRTTKQELQLPQLPNDNHGNTMTDTIIPMLQSGIPTTHFSYEINPIISYYCNRGIGVELSNKSIVCFCPPQYYGDKCQFHNDRITILFHLNLSQSIYSQSYNPKTMLKLLIIFMNDNLPLMTESFETKVTGEMIIPRKKLVHLFYSRSNVSLYNKRARYFNRSNIINEHPYSVRIEAYELKPSEEPRLVGVWLYPIYFDFLPSFRLAKVLHLTKPDLINNPCSSNSCNGQQKCYPILNQNSTYVCLCPPNYKGENCSLIDKMCEEGFCSLNSSCKPTYRGTLSGIEQPYCICPLNKIGHQCDLIHDRCDPNPCDNNGTCFSTSEPNRFICLCDEYHYGDQCQLEKRGVRLHIKNIPSHRAAVVQYFDINFLTLDLILVHQHVNNNLPALLHYVYIGKTAPGIIVVKFYSNTQNANIYLISIQIDVESINGTIEINETNHCAHVETLFPTKEESPFKYHHLCVQNLSLLCFVDDSYLCICDENHNRAECFGYDHKLDQQCSSCYSRGKCLKANRLKSDFLCLCPECYSGKSCEFSSEYFSFTVDQLFAKSLAPKGSIEKKTITVLLIFGSWLLFLIGLLNNICSFVTFRRVKCLQNGIGHYLLWMSVTNQINLTFLALRLTHLTLNTTNFRSDPYVDMIFCKILNYLLISSGRIPYWLVSLIAIERVYTTIFLRGQWLKKPHIAKCLLMIMLSLVFISGSYELYFVNSHTDVNSDSGAVCTLNFPDDLHIWAIIHKIVTIIHTLVPFLINICSTMTIGYVIIKNKIKITAQAVYAHPTTIQQSETTQQQEQTVKESQDNVEQKDNDDNITHLPTVKEKNRLYLLRDVLIENKELILGPGITLIPQLFSLPLFIISIAFACQDIEANFLRYFVITSSVISFIPQLTSFFLYISPSSFYTQEWRLTNLNKWLQRFRQCRRQDSLTMTTISCTTKDNDKLEINKSK